MKKKIPVLLMTMLLAAGVLPMTAFAQESCVEVLPRTGCDLVVMCLVAVAGAAMVLLSFAVEVKSKHGKREYKDHY